MRRAGRVVAAAIAAGVGGGAVAGFGARVAMWIVRLLNPSHNGEVTHAGAAVGRWTLQGTIDLVAEGVFIGVAGGAAYLAVRRFLPRSTVAAGLAFGALLLALFGRIILDGGYEYVRYVDSSLSVSLFASLYFLYGVAVALFADLIAPRRQENVPGWVRRTGQTLLLIVGLVAGWSTTSYLMFTYRF